MSQTVASPEPPRRYLPGLVPPPGPLPQRFGPSRLLAWFRRLAALAVIVFGVAPHLRSLFEAVQERNVALLVLPALVLVWLLLLLVNRFQSRNRSGGRIAATTVVVTVSGLVIHSRWRRHRFGWGDLLGLEPPAGESGNWAIAAQRGSQSLTIGLPANEAWATQLVGLLSGKPQENSQKTWLDHLSNR